MNEDTWTLFTRRRNTTRLVFLVIILVTLPCYCLGAVMLATAPDNSGGEDLRQEDIATLGGKTSTSLPSGTPTLTPFRTNTPTQQGGPLGPTPSQLWLPTNTLYFYATWTPQPTWTFAPTITTAPSLTPVPSMTLAPTNTLAPTQTPQPTQAPTNTVAPTQEPTRTQAPTEAPTLTPVPTDEVVPTQEVLNEGETNNEASNGGVDPGAAE